MHEQTEQLINWWGLGSAYKDTPALGWYMLTFVIFIWALVYFARKPMMLLLETRALNVEKAIEEAKRAKTQAEEKIAKYELRLKALDGEIANLKSEFLKQGEIEKAAFEKSANDLAVQIAKEAEDNLASEVRRALLSLKSEMAEAIISATRVQIQDSGNLTAEADLKKVFIRDVSELKN